MHCRLCSTVFSKDPCFSKFYEFIAVQWFEWLFVKYINKSSCVFIARYNTLHTHEKICTEKFPRNKHFRETQLYTVPIIFLPTNCFTIVLQTPLRNPVKKEKAKNERIEKPKKKDKKELIGKALRVGRKENGVARAREGSIEGNWQWSRTRDRESDKWITVLGSRLL